MRARIETVEDKLCPSLGAKMRLLIREFPHEPVELIARSCNPLARRRSYYKLENPKS